jgi:DNA-directed RNA polymerase specialized sigma24 family protein
VSGDQEALGEIVRELRDPLYRLALRMVWRPADAEDAAQEILIQVITRLSSFVARPNCSRWRTGSA